MILVYCIRHLNNKPFKSFPNTHAKFKVPPQNFKLFHFFTAFQRPCELDFIAYNMVHLISQNP